MRRSSHGVLLLLTLGGVASSLAHDALADAPGKPMSFHNRLLLNRHAVSGSRSLEVMVLFAPHRFDEGVRASAQFGGQVRRAEPAIGYARIEMPLDRLVAFVENAPVEAYQISSLSEGAWYRDGRPEANAALLRGQEDAPLVPPSSTSRPVLTVDAAHRISRAADEDVGLDAWLAAHPTYDGRGVTIALLESAQPEFSHPAFVSGKALDGTDVPKFAGIINAANIRNPDDTRVDLSTEIDAVTSWHRVGRRTFILPNAGRYRMGTFRLPAGATLVHEFGVLRNEATGEIRIDTDGDADLREEDPIPLSGTAMHIGRLRITSPNSLDLAVALTSGRSPHRLHVYAALESHQTMTASVAAGNRNAGSLAYGVAPGARILLVRMPLNGDLQGFEAFIDAMQHPDVDVVCDSMGIITSPDTSADFIGRFISRLVAAYDKPVVHSAGNTVGRLSSVGAFGAALTVGGATNAAAFTALYGARPPQALFMDPRSSFGPALDGALKPDFLAPMSRLAADVFVNGAPLPVPRNSPTAEAPAGYRISCCTSAASPYAAGVVALLLSAAKQAHQHISAPRLAHALRASARFLPGWASHEQGTGLLQLEAAWQALRSLGEPTTITVTGPNRHTLTPYAADGARGPGLFEREGWRAGAAGTRVLQFTRESGGADTLLYPLSWTGNDGTFETSTKLALPLDRTAALPIRVQPRTAGVHSALLNVHDPSTNVILQRTQVAVVAAHQLDRTRHRIVVDGTLAPLRTTTHYVAVPPNTGAVRVVLQVAAGAPVVAIAPPDGQGRDYYFHLHPPPSRGFPPGTYSLLLPTPTAGTWGFIVSNTSVLFPAAAISVSDDDATYQLAVDLLDASMDMDATRDRSVWTTITNLGAALREPALDVSVGTLRTHRAELPTTGLPHQISIDVPRGTASLSLRLRHADGRTEPMDLFLYDCTSGECFNHDFTLPSASAHTVKVWQPKPGRWVAAVNSAPSPAGATAFVLEEVTTWPAIRHQLEHSVVQPPGSRWRQRVPVPAAVPRGVDTSAVALLELVDARAERDALDNAWEQRVGLPNLAERAVAIATAIVPLP